MKHNSQNRSEMNTEKNQKNAILEDIIINDPETKMRIGIKRAEEIVKRENVRRRENAPLSTEEKAFLNY